MKKRDELLASDQTLRSQPRESGWSTTLRIAHTAHGADIAREAAGPLGLIARGQKKTGSLVRGECRPSVWTIASSARKMLDQMVRQSQLSKTRF